MPFDDASKRIEIELPNRDEIAILNEMLFLLRRRKYWCRGLLHETRESWFFGREHEAYCLSGALNMADHGSPYNHSGSLRSGVVAVRARLRLLARRPRLSMFNDDPWVQHKDILALLRRARRTFE